MRMLLVFHSLRTCYSLDEKMPSVAITNVPEKIQYFQEGFENTTGMITRPQYGNRTDKLIRNLGVAFCCKWRKARPITCIEYICQSITKQTRPLLESVHLMFWVCRQTPSRHRAHSKAWREQLGKIGMSLISYIILDKYEIIAKHALTFQQLLRLSKYTFRKICHQLPQATEITPTLGRLVTSWVYLTKNYE